MNLFIFKFKILSLFILISLILGLVGSVYAQNEGASPTPTGSRDARGVTKESPTSGINLNISPTFLNLSTDPGKAIDSEFRIRNNNDFSENLKLSIVKYVNSENGTPVLSDVESEDEFAKWIKFEDDEFSVGPGQAREVKFTISPPKSASLGYYYGIMVSRVQPEDGTGAVVSGSVVLPVLLEVDSPNAKREIQITSFKTSKLFYEHLPVEFKVEFKNSGNVHVSPVGDIFIDSLFNEEVGVLPVNEGRGNVLPDGVRTFTAKWDDGFAVRTIKMEGDVPVKDESGNTVYETKYDFSKANLFRFGRYTANLLMVYDNGERDIPVEAKVSFWVIPWKILGVGFLIFLFALVGILSILRPLFRKLRR